MESEKFCIYQFSFLPFLTTQSVVGNGSIDKTALK